MENINEQQAPDQNPSDQNAQDDAATEARPLEYWMRAAGRSIIHAVMSGDRDSVAKTINAAVPAEDLETTRASLEAIAKAFGWDEAQAVSDRRRRGPRGFRPGFGPGFRPGFGPGFRPGFGPEGEDNAPASDAGRREYPHPHGMHPWAGGFEGRGHHRGGHGHGGERRHTQRAYERGFDAGFSRGREERSV